MLKKSITYTDFNGETRTEEFYFNLTKAEVAKMELSKNGGMKAYLERIVAIKDQAAIIEEFQKLIKLSYGVKSDDGRKMMKNDELFEDFAATEAYSELFMELATNDKAAAEFVNGILPKIDNMPNSIPQ